MATKIMVLGSIFFLTGIAAFVFETITLRADQVMHAWPTVSGTVESSSIIRTFETYFSNKGNRPPIQDKTVWGLQSVYHYSIGGKTYTGSEATSRRYTERIYADTSIPSQKMKNFLAQLSPGSRVNIHYNPQNMAESYALYLQPHDNRNVFMILIVLGLGLVGWGGHVPRQESIAQGKFKAVWEQRDTRTL